MAGNNLRNPRVDAFISGSAHWKEEFARLRSIALDCGLDEELKWGKPCYSMDGKNIVIIQGFKEYCALLFFKGSLLKDPKGILIRQTENVQAGRQLRFTDAEEIDRISGSVKAYILEAMEVERSGLKIHLKPTSQYPVPAEFQSKLDASPALRSAFESLTPGRQRAYLFYFSQAKQSKTREARIVKHLADILDGKGLLD